MDESRWNVWSWPAALVGDIHDLVAFILVVGVLGLRVLPSTRRWAPRGNASAARSGSRTRGSEPSRPTSEYAADGRD
jgi:hypothetical protein